VELVGHNDLNGLGDGGEGLAFQQLPDGRRILYLAHEAPQRCLSVIDVTTPERPVLVNQLPSPAPGVTRCNSLGLSGTVLAVANQATKAGGTRAGMWVLDVSDFKKWWWTYATLASRAKSAAGGCREHAKAIAVSLGVCHRATRRSTTGTGHTKSRSGPTTPIGRMSPTSMAAA
jgi:hypothetical protein